ncbi:MAG: hypothetical protein FWF15_09720 [Oscillospiraceae bacterium]|nr:hypothetical protein [Oscillospiraceae bacterium]
MKKTKSIAILLLILLFGSILITACSNTSDNSTDTENNENGNTENNEGTLLNVPTDKNYNGYTFSINSYSHSAYRGEHHAEALTGDLVNDAVYDRNKNVEELFNVKINTVIGVWGNDECRSLITKSVLAGDDDFDMFTGNTYNMTFLSAEGYFLRISEVPHINYKSPWWNQYIYNELSVGNNVYLMTGDIALSNYGQISCIFFNKKYIVDYSLQDPYQLVYDNKWYIDTLIAMTKDFWIDLNGNGVRDGIWENDEETMQFTDDLYGIYSQMASIYAIANHWVPITTKNADNYPEVSFYSTRTATMFDKLKDYFINSQGSLCPDGWTDYTVFANGGCIFMPHVIHQTTYAYMRESNVDYGIVPVPKYDENQKDYRTCGGGLVVAVPLTIKDAERTGMVMEALAYYGREFVYPAYLEKTITQKGTRDNDAQKMLEIILNSVYYNFGVAFSGFQGYGYSLLEYFKTSKGFASYYEGMNIAATAELIKYADQILALP